MRLSGAINRVRDILSPGSPWWEDLSRVYSVSRAEALELGTRARGRRPSLPALAGCAAVSGKTLEDLWGGGPRSAPADVAQFYQDVGAWFAFRQVVRHRFTGFGFVAKRLIPGMHLLEFGAGVCPVSWWLLHHGPAYLKVRPVDVPSEHFRFGLDRLRHALPRHQWRMELWPEWCYGGQLPRLRPKRFDAATCLEVFEHLPDPAAAVRWLVDSIKSGGWLFEDFAIHAEPSGPDLAEAQAARLEVYRLLTDTCERVSGRSWTRADGGGIRIWRKC